MMTRNVNWIFNDDCFLTASIILSGKFRRHDDDSGESVDATHEEEFNELVKSLPEDQVEKYGAVFCLVEEVAFDYVKDDMCHYRFKNIIDSLTYHWFKNGHPNIHEVRVYEDGETNVDAYVIERKISTVVGESNEKRKERMAEFNRSDSLSEEERREEVRRITELIKEEEDKEVLQRSSA